MPTEENPHAGTGSVVLDIGGDRGALIVLMPPEMLDMEVEIIPTGTDSRRLGDLEAAPTRDHGHSHDHAEDHSHSHQHDHEHDALSATPPHVAVVARPTPSGSIVHSLVYGSLLEGTYDLYVRPSGAVHLSATVVGGQVTETHWD